MAEQPTQLTTRFWAESQQKGQEEEADEESDEEKPTQSTVAPQKPTQSTTAPQTTAAPQKWNPIEYVVLCCVRDPVLRKKTKDNFTHRRMKYERQRQDLSKEQAAAVWRAGLGRYLVRMSEERPQMKEAFEKNCAKLSIIWPPDPMEGEEVPLFDDISFSSEASAEEETESEEEMDSDHTGDTHQSRTQSTPLPPNTSPLPTFYRGQEPAVSDSASLLLDLKRQRSPEEAQKELKELKKIKIKNKKKKSV